MPRIQNVLLVTTAISLTISGYLWLELIAERKLARRDPPGALEARELREAGRQPGPEVPASGQPRSLASMSAPEADLSAGAASSPAATSAIRMHEQLLRMEFAAPPRYSPEDARRTLDSLYPDLRAVAGLTEADVETLAGLMSRGAYPDESEEALGASTYQRWMDYRRTLDANRGVAILQKRLPDAPLDEHQAAALARVYEDELRWHDAAAPRQPPIAGDRRSKLDHELRAARLELEKHANVIDRARSFLTREQVAELENTPVVELRRAFVAAIEAELNGAYDPGAAARLETAPEGHGRQP